MISTTSDTNGAAEFIPLIHVVQCVYTRTICLHVSIYLDTHDRTVYMYTQKDS